jgi:antitoxin component of RelBE/YafQ-DinJ toxin-antitoxin module
MPQKARQVRTTLQGSRLAELDALVEHLGLTPSGVVRLALKRLAQTELQKAAPLEMSKEAA